MDVEHSDTNSVGTGSGGATSSSTTSMYTSVRTPILLQTARIRVSQPNQPGLFQGVRAIFNCGSQRSYVTNRLKASLTAQAMSVDTLMIKTFGSSEGKTQTCDVVDLLLKTRGGEDIQLPFLAVPLICEPLRVQPLSHVVESFPHLAQLDLGDTGGESDIDMLVGLDLYWRLVTGRVVRGEDGPVAVETVFGWVVSGPTDSTPESMTFMSTYALKTEADMLSDTGLEFQLKQFWNLETLGIQDNEPSVYEEFEKKITFKGSRYEVQLPWKESHLPLCDHYQLSLNRLTSLLQSLRQSPEVLREYDAVIRDQLSRGIVEQVQEPKVTASTHYLPHHAVIRHDKDTTKLHIVFDASAKTTGPSLNDCLYVGPSFGQYILDIILRFCLHDIALVGDIEKAFLMISVAEDD